MRVIRLFFSNTGTSSSSAGSRISNPQPLRSAAAETFSISGSGTNPERVATTPCSAIESRTRQNSQTPEASSIAAAMISRFSAASDKDFSNSSCSFSKAAMRFFKSAGSSSAVNLITGKAVSSISPSAITAKATFPLLRATT